MTKTAEDIKQELYGYMAEFSKNVLSLNGNNLYVMRGIKRLYTRRNFIKHCRHVLASDGVGQITKKVFETYMKIYMSLTNISHMGYPSFERAFRHDLELDINSNMDHIFEKLRNDPFIYFDPSTKDTDAMTYAMYRLDRDIANPPPPPLSSPNIEKDKDGNLIFY